MIDLFSRICNMLILFLKYDKCIDLEASMANNKDCSPVCSLFVQYFESAFQWAGMRVCYLAINPPLSAMPLSLVFRAPQYRASAHPIVVAWYILKN